MSNGAANCVLEICCPADSPRPKEMLANELADHCNLSPADAQRAADWMLTQYDLAERGSLRAFKDSVARLARENP